MVPSWKSNPPNRDNPIPKIRIGVPPKQLALIHTIHTAQRTGLKTGKHTGLPTFKAKDPIHGCVTRIFEDCVRVDLLGACEVVVVFLGDYFVGLVAGGVRD
jgi:hypothetical protein